MSKPDMHAGGFHGDDNAKPQLLPDQIRSETIEMQTPSVNPEAWSLVNYEGCDGPSIDRDVPSPVDLVGWSYLVDSVVHMLMQVDTRPPFCVGIFGRWGAGKSTCMHMIRQRLLQLTSEKLKQLLDQLPCETRMPITGSWLQRMVRRVRLRHFRWMADPTREARMEQALMTSIVFDAWRYKDDREQWVGLVVHVVRSIEQLLPPGTQIFFAMNYSWQTRRTDFVMWLVLLCILITLFLMLYGVMVLMSDEMKEEHGRLYRIIPMVLIALTSIAFMMQKTVDILRPVSEQLEGYLRSAPSSGASLSYLSKAARDLYVLHKQLQNRFARKYNWVLKSSRTAMESPPSIWQGVHFQLRPASGCTKSSYELRMIIFIFNLDRCSKEAALKVMEALHLVLAPAGFLTVVALNRSQLREAIEDRYGRDDPSMTTDFLEKLIQMPVYVPIAGDTAADFFKRMSMRHYVQKVEHGVMPDQFGEMPLLTGLSPEQQHLLDICFACLQSLVAVPSRRTLKSLYRQHNLALLCLYNNVNIKSHPLSQPECNQLLVWVILLWAFRDEIATWVKDGPTCNMKKSFVDYMKHRAMKVLAEEGEGPNLDHARKQAATLTKMRTCVPAPLICDFLPYDTRRVWYKCRHALEVCGFGQ